MNPFAAELNGSTLDAIEVDWRNGKALITFLASPRTREGFALRMSDFTRVEVLRAPSASRVVRELRRGKSSDRSVVEIETETGEVVRLEAREIQIRGIGG